MKKSFSLAVLMAVQATFAGENNVGLPRYPALSPDGTNVVFSWHGDLWRVPTAGGAAERLTSNTGEELFSTYSPDGKQIAFASDRVGGGNLFIMDADGTGVRQISLTDRYYALSDWAGDHLYFHGRLEHDWYSGLRSYSISTDGGDPSRAFDAFGSTPSVSPDGSKILLTRGGSSWTRRNYRGPDARDVWLFDKNANTYTQITKWNGNDGRAKWIDNQSFIFSSDQQDDTVNLYVMKPGEDASKARRLTDAKGVDIEEFDIAADGKTVVYQQWNRLYRLDLASPDAKAVAIDIAAKEDSANPTQYRSIERLVSDAALSPDGKTMAVVAFGQVYVRGTEARAGTRRVSNGQGECSGVVWSADGDTLFFVGEHEGVDAIYTANVTLARSDVKKAVSDLKQPTSKPAEVPSTQPATQPTSQPTTQPTTQATVAAPTTAPTTQAALPTTQGMPSEPAVQELADGASEPAATLLALVPATQPSDDPTTQPTTAPTTSPASQPSTQPAKAAKPEYKNRWPDALRFEIKPLVTANTRCIAPSPSPDGKLLAYERGVGQLWIRDLATGDDRMLVDGWSDALEWRWSPDSRQIAYVTEDMNNNADVFIVPADGSAKPVNISRHPDNEYSPRWSADGKMLAMLSMRNDNETDVYAVFLDRDIESLSGTDLDQYYKEAGEKAKKRERPKPGTLPPPTTRPATQPATAPTTQSDSDASSDATTQAASQATASSTTPSSTTTPTSNPTTKASDDKSRDDLETAYLRLRRLTAMTGNEANLEVAPAGDKFYFSAQHPGGRGIFVLDRAGGEPRRLADSVGVLNMTFDGDKLVIVNGGRAGTLNLTSGQPEFFDVSDRLAIDRSQAMQGTLVKAARILGATYYDDTMNGLDWPAVTERYRSLVADAATPDEFNYVAAKLVGELNGSHLGINMPDSPNPDAIGIGRLGIRAAREGDGYRVTSILREATSAKGEMKLEVGDLITHIESQDLTPPNTLDGRMANRTGIETLVTVERTVRGETRPIDLLVMPMPFESEAALFYTQWRTDTAAKVAELSGGTIGYIHIRGMDQGSLDVFERDLFAAADGKKGLIIDVRNNGGGWTTDRLLASIMYPRHAYTRPRGYKGDNTDTYPQDRLFIQRYNLPINMLCNEKSFSNAEIISHAFKHLKRGTLVGQQTAGGVISTGGTSLLDGTSVRLPGRGWFTPDGTNMEMNGAMPDLVVPQTPEAEAAQQDEQLKTAVDDLMKRLAIEPGR